MSLRVTGAQSDKNAPNIGGSQRNLEESSNSYYFQYVFTLTGQKMAMTIPHEKSIFKIET
jgi:hypothetical protein